MKKLILSTMLLTGCGNQLEKPKTIKKVCIEGRAYMYVVDTAITALLDKDGKPVTCKREKKLER